MTGSLHCGGQLICQQWGPDPEGPGGGKHCTGIFIYTWTYCGLNKHGGRWRMTSLWHTIMGQDWAGIGRCQPSYGLLWHAASGRMPAQFWPIMAWSIRPYASPDLASFGKHHWPNAIPVMASYGMQHQVPCQPSAGSLWYVYRFYGRTEDSHDIMYLHFDSDGAVTSL